MACLFDAATVSGTRRNLRGATLPFQVITDIQPNDGFSVCMWPSSMPLTR